MAWLLEGELEKEHSVPEFRLENKNWCDSQEFDSCSIVLDDSRKQQRIT
jgi:hypothetical protein